MNLTDIYVSFLMVVTEASFTAMMPNSLLLFSAYNDKPFLQHKQKNATRPVGFPGLKLMAKALDSGFLSCHTVTQKAWVTIDMTRYDYSYNTGMSFCHLYFRWKAEYSYY